MAAVDVGAPEPQAKFVARDVYAWFGDNRVLHGITLNIAPHRAIAIIGPSGCGKSTFIRCLNRMHELVPSARVEGEIRLDGIDVYDRTVDPVLLRRRVGMVFQKPNPFPSMSIRENVVSGLRMTGRLPANGLEETLEKALRQAALWEEVKDRLGDPGIGLSGGSSSGCASRVRWPSAPTCC